MRKELSPRTRGETSGACCRRDRLVGTILGSYLVTARIAEGGMGIIYRAEHVRLPRAMAIKVLKPELADHPELIDRLLEEAQAVNRVRHPNLVDIVDVGEVPSTAGQPPLVYLVMELLEGIDLSLHLQQVGPLDPLEAVEIADQIADALVAVHDQQILHLDLKAENVFLVRRPDGSAVAKLLDFGIAARFGSSNGSCFTKATTGAGTPGCMAPEQVTGETLDERTDIYAFGLIIYHMLRGAPAFHSTSIEEVLSDQLYARPAPLRSRRLGTEATIPVELEQVVMRCLEKRPEDRFSDMRAVRSAMWAAIGVPDRRLYLQRRGLCGARLGEAPTVPPIDRAPLLPVLAQRRYRRRWLATGVLAGMVLPLLGIALRTPQLYQAGSEARCGSAVAGTALAVPKKHYHSRAPGEARQTARQESGAAELLPAVTAVAGHCRASEQKSDTMIAPSAGVPAATLGTAVPGAGRPTAVRERRATEPSCSSSNL